MASRPSKKQSRALALDLERVGPARRHLRPLKSPRQQRAKETVDAILEATARVLAREGFEGTSTNRVAEVAGVSISSLYQYFACKEALFAALIDRHLRQVEGLFEGAAPAESASLAEVIAVFVERYFALFAERPEMHLALHVHTARLGSFERVVEARRQVIASVTRMLVRRPEFPDEASAASAATDATFLTESLVLSGLYEDPAAMRSGALAARAVAQVKWTLGLR